MTAVVVFALPLEWLSPTPTDCVSAEIARRTVRIETSAGWCSGVLVTPRLIRTAAHCFTADKILKHVWTGDRVELKANYELASRLTDTFDQAELYADQDLVDVDPLPIVTIRSTDQWRGVVVVGYPRNGSMVRHAAVVATAPSGRAGSANQYQYKLVAEDRWRAGPGSSGGPTFSPFACQLRLVGINEASGSGYTYVQNVLPINPTFSSRGLGRARAGSSPRL